MIFCACVSDGDKMLVNKCKKDILSHFKMADRQNLSSQISQKQVAK